MSSDSGLPSPQRELQRLTLAAATWRRQRPRVGLRAGSAPGRRHAAVALRALSGAPIALESWSLDPFVELFRNDSQFFNASFKQNPSENGASIKYDF